MASRAGRSGGRESPSSPRYGVPSVTTSGPATPFRSRPSGCWPRSRRRWARRTSWSAMPAWPADAAAELATLAEHGLPVTVVVLNNRSLGWIRWYRRITFGRGWEDEDFADVAFAEVASGFGLHGQRVTEPGQLGPALRGALTGRPALVDVVTEAWQTPIRAHRRAAEPTAEGATTAGY